MDVVWLAAPAHIDEFTCLNQHVARRNDIHERGVGRISVGEPHRNWDIVRGPTVLDWEQAMRTEEQLRPPVIVCLL